MEKQTLNSKEKCSLSVASVIIPGQFAKGNGCPRHVQNPQVGREKAALESLEPLQSSPSVTTFCAKSHIVF